MASTTAKYDRDKLIVLLSERAAFEHAAVRLYDSAMQRMADIDDEIVQRAMPDLHRYREEEVEHAELLDQTIRQLGGDGRRSELVQAVVRESTSLQSIVSRRTNRDVLPILHAMLASELMDEAGWHLLLDIAHEVRDDDAIQRLETIVEREGNHLALVREMMHALARRDVELLGEAEGERQEALPPTKTRTPEVPSKREPIHADMSGPARATTVHDEIVQWVESRGGTPAHVKGTGRNADPGILRIDFPGFSGEGTLERLDWARWLKAFEDNDLVFVYEEKTADGKTSRFNKLIARQTLRRRQAGEHDASVHKGRPAGRAAPAPRTPQRGGRAQRGPARGRAAASRASR